MKRKISWSKKNIIFAIVVSLFSCIDALYLLFPLRTTTTEHVFFAQSQTSFQLIQQVCSEYAYVDIPSTNVEITKQEFVSTKDANFLVIEGTFGASQNITLRLTDISPAYGDALALVGQSAYPAEGGFLRHTFDASGGFLLSSDAVVEDRSFLYPSTPMEQVSLPFKSIVFTCAVELVFVCSIFLTGRKSRASDVKTALHTVYEALPDEAKRTGANIYQKVYRQQLTVSLFCRLVSLIAALVLFSGRKIAMIWAVVALGLTWIMAVLTWFTTSAQYMLSSQQDDISTGIAAITAQSLPEYAWRFRILFSLERVWPFPRQCLMLSSLLRLNGEIGQALKILDIAHPMLSHRDKSALTTYWTLRCLLLWELQESGTVLSTAKCNLEKALSDIQTSMKMSRIQQNSAERGNAALLLLNGKWRELMEVEQLYQKHAKSVSQKSASTILLYYAAKNLEDTTVMAETAQYMHQCVPKYASRFCEK